MVKAKEENMPTGSRLDFFCLEKLRRHRKVRKDDEINKNRQRECVLGLDRVV
jgi:hypothetical protein